ncbi:MAG: CDP-diacylglycerol--glycerol-3-phosphate 3-phosphatidyltransferase [Clostridia bacterium]|nr:CDP-diacylglycerol--glycerol-3-phosphate 3-phosphatidyltransferase [Clostridia bacterium]
MQKKFIPNILSFIRLCLVPLFAVMFFWNYPSHVWAAVFVFFLAGATDVLDGWLARRNNWVSNVGKILDPLADKTMQCTALICFSIKNIIPLWLTLIYICKELLIGAGALFVFRKKSVVVKSSFWGKFAVCVFYVSIAALVALQKASEEVKSTWTIAISMIMLCFAVVALIQYFREYIKSKNTK